MNDIISEERRRGIETAWWVALCGLWLLVMFHFGASAFRDGHHFRAFLCFCFAMYGCPYFLDSAKWIADYHVRWLQDQEVQKAQRATEASIQVMAHENEAMRNQASLAQSSRELVLRLGNVDQFIRVLEHEQDSDKRTVALQAAQSEVTTISAKLAAGEIQPQALSNQIVVDQAYATQTDLGRIGLGDDRIARDLVRLFGSSPRDIVGSSRG